MRWWGWLLTAILTLLALAMGAAIYARRRFCEEFTGFLNQHWPELHIVGRRGMMLETRGPKDDERGQIDMRPVYRLMLATNAHTLEQRTPIYRDALAAYREGSQMSGTPFRPEDADKLMPRLVTADFFVTGRSMDDVPHVALGNTGLFAVCVLNGLNSVLYLTRPQLMELGLSEPELFIRALANLGKTFPAADAVRGVIVKPNLMVIKGLDTFDAARLLLLPDALEPGETLVAAVPDRDTLVFTKAPDDGNYASYRRLLTPGSDRLLLNRILKVTADGVELAD